MEQLQVATVKIQTVQRSSGWKRWLSILPIVKQGPEPCVSWEETIPKR